MMSQSDYLLYLPTRTALGLTYPSKEVRGQRLANVRSDRVMTLREERLGLKVAKGTNSGVSQMYIPCCAEQSSRLSPTRCFNCNPGTDSTAVAGGRTYW